MVDTVFTKLIQGDNVISTFLTDTSPGSGGRPARPGRQLWGHRVRAEGEVGADLWSGGERSEAGQSVVSEAGGGQPGGRVREGGGRPGQGVGLPRQDGGRDRLLGEHGVHLGRSGLQGRPVTVTVTVLVS